jgi:hypothetical protein
MIICTTDNNHVVQNFGGIMSDNTTQDKYERKPGESLPDWIGRLAPHCNRCREQQLPFGPALMEALNHFLEAVEQEGVSGHWSGMGTRSTTVIPDYHKVPHPPVSRYLDDKNPGSCSQ